MSTTKLLLHMDGDTSSEIGGNDSYTKFLCHMDTTPLIDSSHDVFTITNNNVTVNTSIKKFGGGSGYFNGSSAYLSMADSDVWDFGSSDFTIDVWVRTGVSSTQSVVIQNEGVVSNSQHAFHMWMTGGGPAGRIGFGIYSGESSYLVYTTTQINDNEFHHIAVVRDGNTLKIACDGTFEGSVDVTGISTNSIAGPFVVGRRGVSSEYYWNGYIDELRVTKLYARWTDTFTPPTTYYGGHNTLQVGNPKLDSATKKFGSSSMYFDGASYINIGNNNDWYFGADDFTVDFWVNFDAHSVWDIFLGRYEDGFRSFTLSRTNEDKLRMRFEYDGTQGYYITTDAVGMGTGQWYHIAFVRGGTNGYIFLNGVSQALTADTEFSTNDLGNVSGIASIGAWYPPAPEHFVNGNIDEFRVSKGIARWTSNFTPPTAAYETDEYTKLLLHFPGDMSEYNHPVSFNNNTRMDVSPTKWSGSFYFDGVDDYLSIPDSDGWDFSSGDFTIDLWVRFQAFTGTNMIWMCQRVDDNNRWYFGLHGTSGAHFYAADTGAVVVNCNQGDVTGWDLGIWYHVAVVRNGTGFKIYRNGTEIASATSSADMPNLSTELTTGGEPSWGQFNGFADEIRVTKGAALWTSNFTPPSEPFTIYQVSGDLSDNMRILALRETDWIILENELFTENYYSLSFTGNDPVTIIGRKSDGESQGYGNVVPE